MPFDDEEQKEFTPKIGVKQVQGQKSMFEGKPRAPTQQEFTQQVQTSQEKLSGHKKRAAELFIQFNRTMSDKTLPLNRNILNAETEKEMLQNMIQLAIDINDDPNELEGMGSLTWITLLFKTCLSQRDRMNELEYMVSMLQKKTDNTALIEIINKEIAKALDKKKDSE
jgi:hypothetical protein